MFSNDTKVAGSIEKKSCLPFLTGLWSVIADLIDPLPRELLVLSVAVVRTNL